jgi:hypothetical protein
VLAKMRAQFAPARTPFFEPVKPPVDMLGRPAVLPCPPLSIAWMALAAFLAGLAGLFSVLP